MKYCETIGANIKINLPVLLENLALYFLSIASYFSS